MTAKQRRYTYEERPEGWVVQLVEGKTVISEQPPVATEDDAKECIEGLKAAEGK